MTPDPEPDRLFVPDPPTLGDQTKIDGTSLRSVPAFLARSGVGEQLSSCF